MALRERPPRLAVMWTVCLALLVAAAAQAQVSSVRIYNVDPTGLTPVQQAWTEASVLSQAVSAAGEPAFLELPLAKRFPPVLDQGVADTALRSLARPLTARAWTGAAYGPRMVWFQAVSAPANDPVTANAIQRYRFRVVPPGVRVPAVKVTNIVPDATPTEDLTVFADPWICGTDTWTLFVPGDGSAPTITDGSAAVHDLNLLANVGGTRYYESHCGALFIKIGPPDAADTTYTISTSSNCWFSPAIATGNPLIASRALDGLQWGTGRVELQWQVDDNTAGVLTDDIWRVDANPNNYDTGDADADGETLEFRTIAGVFSVSQALAFVDQDGDGVQELYLGPVMAEPGAASLSMPYQVRNTALARVKICPYCGAHVDATATSCPYDGRDLTTVTPSQAQVAPRYGPDATFESQITAPSPSIPFEGFSFATLPGALAPGEAYTNAWTAVKVPTFQPASGAMPYGLANVDDNPVGVVDDPVPPMRLFTEGSGWLSNGVWDAYLVCPTCGRRRTLAQVQNNGWICTRAGCVGVRYEDATVVTTTVRAGRPYHGNFGQAAGPDIGMKYDGVADTTTTLKTLGADAARFNLTFPGTTAPYAFRWGTVTPDGPPATNAPIPAAEVAAEDYDSIALALDVPGVAPRLATDVRTLDLGKVAPGDALSTVFDIYPSEFSAPGSFAAENWSNYPLDGVAGPQVFVQFSDLVPTGVDVYAASPGRMYQAGIIPSSVYMLTDAMGAPISAPIRPVGVPQVTTFGPLSLNAQWPGELVGLGAPLAAQQGQVAAAVPVPNGTPSGTYRGTATAFIDSDPAGLPNFADGTEPQTTFQVRLTVTESWLPYNSALAADSLPAGRIHTDAAGEPNGLQVFWASNRVDQGGSIPAPGDAFWNILYADAVPVVGPATDPGYRDYKWLTNRLAPAVDQPWLPFPTVPLAGDAYGSGPTAVTSSAPTTYQGAAGSSWLAWQRRVTDPTTGRTASALIFNVDPAPPDGGHERPGASVPVYSTTRTREMPSAFMAADAGASPAPANHWVFWQAGSEGKTRIYCNARFDPMDPTTVTDMRVPLSNALMRSSDPAQVTVPLGGAPVTIQKPRNWPYAFAKDPWACEYIRPLIGGGTASEINVFYSAWLHSEGNADVLWSRFDEMTFGDPTANYGKVPFAPVTEEPQADSVRQVFRATHLDWITTAPDAALGQVGFAATGGAVAAPDPLIQWWWRDTAGVVTGPLPITWDPLQSQFDPDRGVYVLRGTNLADPVTSMPVTMTVDPTAGIVQFSRQLFNTLNPADPTAVMNTVTMPTVDDVGLTITYGPYTYRVTRSPQTDDMPAGFFDTFGRLTVFWRRSRATAEKPFFGDTSFWHRTYDLSAHVLRPPMAGAPTVTEDDGVTAIPGTEWIADIANGYVRFSAAYEGRYVRISYTQSAGPAWTERHLIRGWGAERPVPIETVVSDAPVRVAQETYTVPGLGMQAVKYWLFWASTRDVYVGGTTATTSDVYYTTVMP